MNEYKPDILQVRDPVTGEFVPIAAIKGDKGDVGPEGKQGPKGDPGEVTQADFDREIASLSEQIVQSDWNENDPQSKAFVKNRICYEETSEEVIFPAQDVAFDVDGFFYYSAFLPEIGSTVKVKWGDSIFESTIMDGSALSVDSYIGNLSILGAPVPDTGEPYFIAQSTDEDYSEWASATGEGTINVSVSKVAKSVVKIPEKYLPNTVGKKTAEGGETFNSAAIAGDNSHAEGMQTNAIGRYSHTECLGESNAFPGTVVSNTRVEEKRFDVNATIGKIKLPYVAILYQDGVEKVSMLVKEVKPKEGVFTLVGYTRPAGLVDGTYDLVIAKGIATKEAAHAEGTKTIANARHAHTEGDKTIVTSAVEKDGTSIGTGIAGHAEGTETMVYGANGHAEGFRTVVTGENAHAEGDSTIASGAWSHAEGDHATAHGGYSHAEGRDTTAHGGGSHAEGLSTTASGYPSHAEGDGTTASSGGSHAEGLSTTASGVASHAEGRETTASGYASHAEGWDVIASEQVSHAEGFRTVASGANGHAEGNRTTASGKGSHAEGGALGDDGYNLPDRNDNGVIIQGSLASGIESHAEGCQTHASGYVSHAEGEGTTASAYHSHAEGRETTASGTASHAEGSHTTASDSYSHAEGWTTTASGSSSHAEGCQTHASGHTSHAEGSYTTASGNYSHAEGRETVASGNAQHVQGQYNIPDTNDGTPEGTPNNKYAHIVGNGEYGSPSNAHTLDWEGNSWYQGSVLVGGKDMDAPMAVVAPDHIIIKASDSEDRFKITVDSTGAIKAEKVVPLAPTV